jgi:hypothetical protein
VQEQQAYLQALREVAELGKLYVRSVHLAHQRITAQLPMLLGPPWQQSHEAAVLNDLCSPADMRGLHVLQATLAKLASLDVTQASAMQLDILQTCDLGRGAIAAARAEGRRLRKAAGRQCFLVLCSQHMLKVLTIGIAAPAGPDAGSSSCQNACTQPQLSSANVSSGTQQLRNICECTSLGPSNQDASGCAQATSSPDAAGITGSRKTVPAATPVTSHGLKDGGAMLLARLKQRLERVSRKDESGHASSEAAGSCDPVQSIRQARHRETLQRLSKIQEELGMV